MAPTKLFGLNSARFVQNDRQSPIVQGKKATRERGKKQQGKKYGVNYRTLE
jgi:hypothetical protein